jgi:hypothetical protein
LAIRRRLKMKIFAVFDEKGFPKAFFSADIHKEIPAEAIEIGEKIWKQLITNPKLAFVNGVLIDTTNKVWEEGKGWRDKTEEELKLEKLDNLQRNLKILEFQRVQEVLDQYGYKDLGDVQYWHSQDPDDPEPKAFLEWYKAYDDAIWEEIDNLQNKTFEELQSYNPVEVERRIFEQTKSKLPPMGG